MRLVILLSLLASACAGGHPISTGDDTPGVDAHVDPTGDGGPDGDGGTDAPPTPVTCGGSICRADQSCDAGVCTFGCVGSHVPGDYATIQAAVDALAATGADATICLAGMQYTEPTIYVRDTGSHHKTLEIIGESMARTTIAAELYVTSGWTHVTLRGVHVAVPADRTALHVQGGNGAADATLSLVGTKLSGNTGLDATQRQDIRLDGCEIAADSYGMSLYASVSGPLVVRVENSYLHGGNTLAAYTYGGSAVNLTFVNNTVTGGGDALDIEGQTTAVVANNIFTGMTGTALEWFAPAMVTRQNNALWNNTTNYAGLASDGPGTLKLDCLLDATTGVPSLRSGSPCRDAGDATLAPVQDFLGAARGAAPDLGAVEGS